MNDSEIVQLFWERSEDAIAEAAKRYGPTCLAIARNILRGERDAEECVNDAYLRAWEAIPPARPQRLGAFLGRIVRNLALDRYRRERAGKRGGGQVELALAELEDCVPTVVTVEQGLEDAQVAQVIQAYLEEQPPQRRIPFVQRYWYLSPVKRIAADQRMTQGQVRSLLFRMRGELRDRLEKEGVL